MDNTIYRYELVGEFISPLRGGVPEDCNLLLKKKSKDVTDLLFKVLASKVEALIQAGKADEAMEAIKSYEHTEVDPYNNPLNVFKRDLQNGGAPYMGAHWVFGAIRDALKAMSSEYFYGGGKKNAPSSKHLRKYIDVIPYHIFLHRPTYDGNGSNIVKVVDGIENQQPSESVKGFSRYEYINSPVQFYCEVLVTPRGPFFDLLEDPDNVKEGIIQARNHRLGSCRSAGYGMWNIISLTLKTSS